MIHEEATFEAFGYYASEVQPEKRNHVIASCELCGNFRVVVRYGYRTFCFRCLPELERRQGKCICLECGKVFKSFSSAIKRGEGKYCCLKCYQAVHYKGGARISDARSKAKRRRELSYTLLLPLKEGEVGHHVTDEYIIGIQEEVHIRLGGGSREKHRAKVLERLKENDTEKYKLALKVYMF